jgi:chaperone modulatory protein CbpM
MKSRTLALTEAAQVTGLATETISAWIERQWVAPLNSETLDEEDIARLELIIELQEDLGVNEESVPLILHLVDQLCHIQGLLNRWDPRK